MGNPGTLDGASPADVQPGALLPDVTLPGVLYVEVDDRNGGALFLARSTDDGETWRKIPLPEGVTVGAMQMVSDRRLPGMLILRSSGGADVLYATADGGATWRQLRCPGDLHGICPSAKLDNALGEPVSEVFRAANMDGSGGPTRCNISPTRGWSCTLRMAAPAASYRSACWAGKRSRIGDGAASRVEDTAA